ncbi:MAG: DUF3035 domain-containing protein [Hyphomonadaceae bacterium]
MTKPIAVMAVLAAAAAVSGCQSLSNTFGANKNAPDEFRIVTAAPLTLPPDYSLRPPRPGDPRPQELAPDAEARAALFGSDTGQNASPGERALVAGAGADAVDPNIRDQVDFEGSNVVHRNEEFANRVVEFQGSEAEAAAAQTDEQAAQRRLEEEEAIRRATGGGDVVIERREQGFKLPGT